MRGLLALVLTSFLAGSAAAESFLADFEVFTQRETYLNGHAYGPFTWPDAKVLHYPDRDFAAEGDSMAVMTTFNERLASIVTTRPAILVGGWFLSETRDLTLVTDLNGIAGMEPKAVGLPTATGWQYVELNLAFNRDLHFFTCSADRWLEDCAWNGNEGNGTSLVDALDFLIVPQAGDTDGDGIVGISDLNDVRNNFGGTGLGDLNGDGVVGIADLNAVRNNFGADIRTTAVPEPASVVLIGLCAVTLVIKSRRRG